MSSDKSSRLKGFYKKPWGERMKVLSQTLGLNLEDRLPLQRRHLTPELADAFIENAIGGFELPLGVATNFTINGRDVLVPMAVEESSVVAAASHGALMARAGGGFHVSCDDSIMIGQVQLELVKNSNYEATLIRKKQAVLDIANSCHERLVERGGGALDLSWKWIPELESLVVHLHINTCDAMGANIVNTMCEKVSHYLGDILQASVGLCILSNLADQRLAMAKCVIPKDSFQKMDAHERSIPEAVVAASQFAEYDIYRATTHNKGVMNGIDPVVIATGNDWRAVEAGAHAYAVKDGRYRPLATWSLNENGDLCGELELPLALGTVGGVTRLHPTAQTALEILGLPDSKTLAGIICAVGLAQNLSALRALATEGIQQGHMNLHGKNLILQQKKHTEQVYVRKTNSN
ncbi:MAG: hydroxymethylglutaryl-CoA reductase, degradative [Oligoflexales bacterium]